MADKKYSFRNEILWESQKAKEDKASKNWNRNLVGLFVSAIVFLIVLLTTLNGLHWFGRFGTFFIVFSLMGVFFFGRELRVLPLGQLIASGVKAALCLGMALCYVILHQGFWDWMDYSILGILVCVVLLDLPRVTRAWKELKV